jgi:hypothetical protein
VERLRQVNLFLAIMVIAPSNGKPRPPLPDWLGWTVMGVLVAMIILCMCVCYAQRNDPVPILKRTKNPYRRYKRVGWKYPKRR